MKVNYIFNKNAFEVFYFILYYTSLSVNVVNCGILFSVLFCFTFSIFNDGLFMYTYTLLYHKYKLSKSNNVNHTSP